MNEPATNIECPNRGHEIDVNELLYHQVDEQLKKKYHTELARERLKFRTQADELKSARCADCLQTVHTRSRQNCSTIYAESKRTEAFLPGSIEKFRHDMREKGADIGMLVTGSIPSDMARLGLREPIIRPGNAVTAQDNKGDKMDMLYDFLTGNEFRLQVEAIVEGFTRMQTDLESAKRSMPTIWKKREKQLRKVLLNTTNMYGSVKDIAGNAIQSVLLPGPSDGAPDAPEFELGAPEE